MQCVDRHQQVRRKLERGGVGCTTTFQQEEFQVNGARFTIVDTVGLGDTSLHPHAVLSNFAAACEAAKVLEGIHSVLFVTNGHFTEAEVRAFTLLTTVIFQPQIATVTTIVRTGFPEFLRAMSLPCRRSRRQPARSLQLVARCCTSTTCPPLKSHRCKPGPTRSFV